MAAKQSRVAAQPGDVALDCFVAKRLLAMTDVMYLRLLPVAKIRELLRGKRASRYGATAAINSAHSRLDSPLPACSTPSPATIRRTTASIPAESVTAPMR